MELMENRIKIGFITSSKDVLKIYFPTKEEPNLISTEPPFTPDDQIAVNCLRNSYNIKVEAVIWGTSVKDLKSFDAFVIRSPWDYMDSPESRHDFFNWVKELNNLNIKILNSYEILLWLLDKHYLKDFNNVGIKIISTNFIEKGKSINLKNIFKEKGPFIVKPCISAAGIGLRFIETIIDADKYQDEIQLELQNIGFMVQDFIKEIKTNGEWSLIFFDKEYSHAVLKKPSETGILVQGEYGGSIKFKEPPGYIIDFAKNIVSKFNEAYKLSKNENLKNGPLYLRIDVIESENGCMLSEMEGVEPELFFRAKEGSEKLFSEKLINSLKKAHN